MVTNPTRRSNAYLAKLGWDGNITDKVRFRLTGSMYTIAKASNNVLYSGDRAGSRYYSIMENTTSTDAAQAWSGQIQSGFGHNVKAFVVNPFVKYEGFEFFGNFETASGRSWAETTDRTFRQNSFEALYRIGAGEKIYVAGRYNSANGQLAGMALVASKRNRVKLRMMGSA